jgi:hypothetical protein
MPASPRHRVLAAAAGPAPKPFRTFAVRSEEGRHAASARAPYDRVHLVRAALPDAGALALLAAAGLERMAVREPGDVDYANVSLAEIGARAAVADPAGLLADALRETGVLGDGEAPYRRCIERRVDWLGTQGAGFHNDVRDHWTACLFWNLVLAARDVEFVMPHAGLRVPLAPGDLLVFDQTMAHGLCRPGDDGEFVDASFGADDDGRQVFLTGELALPDDAWAALGSPWLPVEEHERRGALDLLAAEFDERSGAVKRVRSLLHCMRAGTRYADAAEPPGEAA